MGYDDSEFECDDKAFFNVFKGKRTVRDPVATKYPSMVAALVEDNVLLPSAAKMAAEIPLDIHYCYAEDAAGVLGVSAAVINKLILRGDLRTLACDRGQFLVAVESVREVWTAARNEAEAKRKRGTVAQRNAQAALVKRINHKMNHLRDSLIGLVQHDAELSLEQAIEAATDLSPTTSHALAKYIMGDEKENKSLTANVASATLTAHGP
ncbi:MAG: hypothetical protein FJ100_16180 [Deltaproteobacteria bacterium]|nr:hypothetical protein [Deltaproteobacteria bacterium]